MRLENLLVVGIALFFVMVVANGEDSVSGESSNIAVILVIDNSKSVNDLDQDGKRFDKAMSFIGLLNNSAHVVGLVSTSGDVIKRGDLDYKRVDPTDNFSKINETIISIRDANKPAKETNIRKLFKLATEQLKDIKYNNKIIIFFSDGVNNCDESENPENIENFWVYTVGLGNDSMGIEFLKNISNSTYSEFNRIDSFYPEILLRGILGRINAEIASIDVNKTAEPSSGSNGSLVNFTINVTNTGNAILNSVILTDTLSEGLDYVSSTGSFDNSSNNVTWDLGLLNKSEPRVVYLIASINSSTFGNLTNFVDVEGKPNPRYAVADNDSVNVTVIDASISVNKTSNVTSGSNGTLVNFTIKVTNTRNATLNPVILTDALPEGLDYVSSTGSFDNSSNNVTWNLGTLDKSEPRVVYLEARINRSEPGILTNLVSVEGKPEFGYNVTDNSSAPVKVVNASISVNKTAYPESGSNGTLVNFTINVTNTGQVNFTQIEVVDVLPYGLDKISYNRSGSVDGQNVTWKLSGLNVSESKFIELVAQINGSKFGNLTNNIIVVGVPPTGDQVKNNDSENVTALRPGIEVNKTADPEEGVPSTNVTFLINVTNTGQVNFTEVEVVDVLPYGFDKISYNRSGSVDGQNVTWILSGLNVSESKFIELVAQINSSKSGNLTNKVTATGVQPSGDKVTANDSENVTVFIPSISVNKTAYPESGSNGTRVNFTIKVTNTGNATLNPVIVTDALPEGLDYVSSTGSFNNSSNNVTWNLGTLDKSKPKMVYLEARINRSGPGILTNLVSVEGKPEFGYNATDNDSIAIPVTIPPMISVNKTAYPESGSNGTRVNFTIKVTNTGNATLNPVILTDALPEGLDYVSSTGSFDNSSNNVTWNLGTLDKSEPRVVYLIARINSSTFGDLTNFVEVEGKPMSGNNVTAKDSADVDVNNVTETLNKTDLILALDTSGSMRKYYRMAKNESAEIVSGWSGFENATISIVSWDHESEIVFGPAPLSGNETRLAEILDNLSEMCMETDLTEYDQGLNGSLAMMRDHPDGVAGSWKIIIFLTGYSEFEPGERLDDYISEANESGYRIFTIGLDINESFNASQKQYSNLTRISEGTGGEFYNVTAFSSEELNPVMYNITRVAEGDLRSTEPGF